jgi:uncharacterized protein
MSFDLRLKVVECLQQNYPHKMTAWQIAKWIFDNHPKECVQKRERSLQSFENDNEFIAQITSEIGAHKGRIQEKNPEIKITSERPRKYFYDKLMQNDEQKLALIHPAQPEIDEKPEKKQFSKSIKAKTFCEADLYPLLSEYLHQEYDIYCKRIDETKSSNKGAKGSNHWLYPDMVGLEDLTQEWSRDIKDCAKYYSSNRSNIYSFEVKTVITRSNLRECFFQAVSNSSWANYGFLVAAELMNDAMRELQILSSLHGIGFILINQEDHLESSQMLLPARYRLEVDWNTANRLHEENKDFQNFIDDINAFNASGRMP